MDLHFDIKELHSKGWDINRIASQLMIHSQTVRKIINGDEDVLIDLTKKNVAPEVRFKKPKISKLSE